MKKLVLLVGLIPTLVLASDLADQAIYDAMNVAEQAHGVPPMIASTKSAGRLTCSKVVNTETNEENYDCKLPVPNEEIEDSATYNALEVEEIFHPGAPSTADSYEKAVGRLSCMRIVLQENSFYFCMLSQKQ